MFYIILGIFLWIVLALIPAMLAKRKGYSFIIFLILSWFVSFLLTLIVVMILKDKNKTAQDRANDRVAEQAIERD